MSEPIDPASDAALSAFPPSDRRRFLTRSAALAGLGVLGACANGPEIRPSGKPAARGRAGARVAPGETIRMGLIGTGGMGTAHCQAILSLAEAGREKVQIVALSDVALPRLEDAAKICSERQKIQVDTYQDYRELLAREDIHCVLVAVPEHWHSRVAIDALMAGKDVYLEKPMTLRLEEAFELRDVVHANDQILQVGTQFVMIPKYREARKLLAEGAIGKPVFSQTSYCRNTPEGEWNYYQVDERVQPGTTLDWKTWCEPLGQADWDPLVYWRWRRYHKYSTGIIGDLLVHVMTPLFYALDAGWPTRVDAIGGHYVDKAMDNHDVVNLTIQFEKEHTMVVAGSTCNETGLETLIRGNRANLLLGGNNVVLQPERPYVDDVDAREIQCAGVSDQDELRLNWLSCVRTREQPASPVDLGTKVMVAVELATRSIWEGKAYHFDPATLTARAAV